MREISGTDLPPLAERRPTKRKKVLFSALAVEAFGQHSISCIIRDLTKEGARIIVSPRADLPLWIYLIVMRDEVAYKCRLIWRKADEAGVAFVESIDLRTHPTTTLTDIWTQHKNAFLCWR